ncbi:MAG: 2-phospho-L-lactate guanylyltransferase [Chloroflexi bacterium]|nr:2-phospho-L-lactate guanylyltransferase [Chloroflexota bacterium]MDA1173659.1 2-phospho-L-lactate guanylyltransferase [Chloroflexota bacterium]
MASAPVPPLRVIVPMKPLDQAKSRLWTDVPTLECESVTLLMLDTVIRAAVAALGSAAVRVVGGDALVQGVVRDAGGTWTEDTGGGLNPSVWSAMQTAYADGCSAALFMPGDLPLVETEDILAIASDSRDNTQPVGVRAEPDGGTNALLVPAACAFAPRLGVDSFAKHTAAAAEVGATLTALDLPRVAFDMDSFDDMIWAKQNIAGFAQKLYDWQAWLEDSRATKENT